MLYDIYAVDKLEYSAYMRGKVLTMNAIDPQMVDLRTHLKEAIKRGFIGVYAVAKTKYIDDITHSDYQLMQNGDYAQWSNCD